MPHWKSLQGKEFLGSWDFEPGEEKIVTITGWDSRKIPNPAKKDEDRPKVVLEFAECKPAVMNTTNCTMIASVLNTDDVDKWVGHSIKLHIEKIRAFGGMKPAIRVMEELPVKKESKKEVICNDCHKVITNHNEYSADQIIASARKKFNLDLCWDCAIKRKEVTNNDTES